MKHTIPPQFHSTGRLTSSQPEQQHLPGTPLAIAASNRMRAALAAEPQPLMNLDFSPLEARILNLAIQAK